MNLKFLRIKLWYTFVIGLLLFNSHFAECQSDRTCDYYFFENNLLPSNFLFINCTAKVANGYLTSSISASNSSNKAIWSITLNKDIQNFSTLNFSYKVGNPKASKKIGFNLSLVINGVPGLNTNGSNRTISYNLDGSSDEWQHATLDISSLIAAWKVVNSNLKYTQVDQINIGIGTTAGSLDYTGDISFDSIFIGNHLKIKSVSLTPSNANQINLIFSRPIGPVTSISGFFISEKGVNNPIVSFQQNTDSSLLFNLTNTLVNSSMGVVSPSLKYSASSLNIHDSLFSEIPILRDDSLTINLNDFLMNTYWPYWGKYDIKNISSLQAQIWKGLDGTIDGWDWSLPPSVKPAPTSLFNIWRTNSLTNSNIANAPTVNFPCNAMLSHWINWKDIEATQGQYKFDALASRIALAKSKGYKSEIRFLFTTQAQVPAWLSSRTDLTFKTGSSYTTTTYDPTNPTYHKFYLAFVDAFAKSGLASNPDVASIYIGYVSPSLGDEGICPVNGDDGDPDPLVITPEEQIGKERLDHWAAATLGYSNKIMMGGDSKYGFGLGFGRRGGFVEHYLYEIPSASIGQIVEKINT